MRSETPWNHDGCEQEYVGWAQVMGNDSDWVPKKASAEEVEGQQRGLGWGIRKHQKHSGAVEASHCASDPIICHRDCIRLPPSAFILLTSPRQTLTPTHLHILRLPSLVSAGEELHLWQNPLLLPRLRQDLAASTGPGPHTANLEAAAPPLRPDTRGD